MENSIILHEMFCGVGPLIHKILWKGWRTSQQGRVEYEDYFNEFVVLWLKRREKYDPARGAMTTFAGMMALNFVRAEIKKNDRRPQMSQFDDSLFNTPAAKGSHWEVPTSKVDFSDAELQLIEAYEHQPSKKAIGLAKRLCDATQMDKTKLLELAETIQEKVALRQKPRRSVLA